MHIYFVILGALAVWRITHLVSQETGPSEIFTRIHRFADSRFWGQLLDCFYCLSLWVAAPFALWLGQSWKEKVLLWPAISSAAILLERATAERQPASRGFYIEEREDEHVLR